MANVALLSFAARKDELYLGEQLRRLGYRNLINIERDGRSSNLLADDGVLVLQLCDISILKNRIVARLKPFLQSPILGLFNNLAHDWDDEIAGLCRDVAVWPCSESELSYRMQRIAKKSRKLIDNDKYLLKLNIVGESEKFQKVLRKVERIAQCDAPVYIGGETGTGKELIARAVHYSSARSASPFVALNCGALPDNLVENELFGHARGAFTDAKTTQQGMIAHAEGGTLFLDEIETLSPKGQISLLRFLQDYEYRPIGAAKCLTANVRLITASNEPLELLVEQGHFRRDLYYRISIMNIGLPPLRERTGDIELLTEHFLTYFREKYNWLDRYIHHDTLQGMQRYSWPGNVRELENILHREFILSDLPEIKIPMFEQMPNERRCNQRERRCQGVFDTSMCEAKLRLVRDFEFEYLSHVMVRAKGNITEAAKIAGKERRTFSKLLEKYAICRTDLKH